LDAIGIITTIIIITTITTISAGNGVKRQKSPACELRGLFASSGLQPCRVLLFVARRRGSSRVQGCDERLRSQRP
jgi:hypothetical protein